MRPVNFDPEASDAQAQIDWVSPSEGFDAQLHSTHGLSGRIRPVSGTSPHEDQ